MYPYYSRNSVIFIFIYLPGLYVHLDQCKQFLAKIATQKYYPYVQITLEIVRWSFSSISREYLAIYVSVNDSWPKSPSRNTIHIYIFFQEQCDSHFLQLPEWIWPFRLVATIPDENSTLETLSICPYYPRNSWIVIFCYLPERYDYLDFFRRFLANILPYKHFPYVLITLEILRFSFSPICRRNTASLCGANDF